MLKWHGVVGAAIAWTLRVALDEVLLFAAAGWLSKAPFPHWRRVISLFAGVAVTFAAAAAPLALTVKIPFVVSGLLLFAVGSVVPSQS